VSTPRALIVIDDSPHRVRDALTLFGANGNAPPAAVHVVCSSIGAAERNSAAIARWLSDGKGRGLPRRVGGLVAGPSYAHVLGGDQGRAARDADCCLRAAEWLFGLVQDIHRQGLGIDAVAGPVGPLRAMLLRGAIETAGTSSDRLYLFRGTVAGNKRSSRASGNLLLIPHVPPSTRDRGIPSETYGEIVRRRTREWEAGTNPEPVVMEVATRTLRIGASEVALTPDQTFWYTAFALRPGSVFPHREFGSVLKLDHHGAPQLVVEASQDGVELHEWLRHLEQVYGYAQPKNCDRFGQMLVNACDLMAPQLGAMLAKIAGAIHAKVGPAAERYCVRARRGFGYRLDVPPTQVTVILPNTQRP